MKRKLIITAVLCATLISMGGCNGGKDSQEAVAGIETTIESTEAPAAATTAAETTTAATTTTAAATTTAPAQTTKAPAQTIKTPAPKPVTQKPAQTTTAAAGSSMQSFTIDKANINLPICWKAINQSDNLIYIGSSSGNLLFTLWVTKSTVESNDIKGMSDAYIYINEKNETHPMTLISSVNATYNNKDAVEVILTDKDTDSEFITRTYIVYHNEKYYIITMYYPKSCETSEKAFIKEAFDSVTFVK